jgi:hypothetical protein
MIKLFYCVVDFSCYVIVTEMNLFIFFIFFFLAENQNGGTNSRVSGFGVGGTSVEVYH